MGDYERTRHLMRERQDLQAQRKQANMSASLHRYQVRHGRGTGRYGKGLRNGYESQPLSSAVHAMWRLA